MADITEVFFIEETEWNWCYEEFGFSGFDLFEVWPSSFNYVPS